MIFERCQYTYTLRSGRLDDFWEAQRTWMVQDPTAELMEANQSYFGTRVHTHRTDPDDVAGSNTTLLGQSPVPDRTCRHGGIPWQ